MDSRLLLRATELSKNYSSQNAGLDVISVNIQRGDRLGIVGETGSGKSTLLKLLAGLIQPDSGVVLLEQTKLQNPDDQLIPGHPHIAYLSQHFELPKFKQVKDHLSDPYLISPDDAEKTYKSCRVDHLLERENRVLSGGEKQRVALAKLLLSSPKLLLLDEPFSNLDFNHKRIIQQVIQDIETELNTTVVMVTHDPKDVLAWADEILVLRQGRLIQMDSPRTIYEKPVNTYVAGLFGAYNWVDAMDWGLSSEMFTVVDSKSIVRPEHFTINNDGGKEGRVILIRYQGLHDEITVQAGKDQVIVYVFVDQYKVGDRVHLSLK